SLQLVFGYVAQPKGAHGFERAQPLEQGLLERAPDCHYLADRLHLRAEHILGLAEFLEVPLRNLDDHVVNRRLETGRRLLRDVVRNLVERVADGELGRDLRDGKPRGLRRQGGGARDARVHLDDAHVAVLWADGELYVRAAGLDADLAYDAYSHVAQTLVLDIGQGLRGCDRDGV